MNTAPPRNMHWFWFSCCQVIFTVDHTRVIRTCKIISTLKIVFEMPNDQKGEMIIKFLHLTHQQLSDLHISLVSLYCQKVISQQARWMRMAFPLISIADLPSGSLWALMPCHFPKIPIEQLQTLQCPTLWLSFTLVFGDDK